MRALARMRATEVFPTPRAPVKQIGMGDTVQPNRILQRPGHMGLADDLIEGLRAPFACYDQVGHKWLRRL